MLGRVSDRAAACLRDPEIADFYARLVMRTSPKSYKQARTAWARMCVRSIACYRMQAMGEVTVCATFLDNFSGDNVRYLARSFGVAGDHNGQVGQFALVACSTITACLFEDVCRPSLPFWPGCIDNTLQLPHGDPRLTGSGLGRWNMQFLTRS